MYGLEVFSFMSDWPGAADVLLKDKDEVWED